MESCERESERDGTDKEKKKPGRVGEKETVERIKVKGLDRDTD